MTVIACRKLGELHPHVRPSAANAASIRGKLSRMMRIENPSSFLLVQAQASCKLRIADAGIAHRGTGPIEFRPPLFSRTFPSNWRYESLS